MAAQSVKWRTHSCRLTVGCRTLSVNDGFPDLKDLPCIVELDQNNINVPLIFLLKPVFRGSTQPPILSITSSMENKKWWFAWRMLQALQCTGASSIRTTVRNGLHAASTRGHIFTSGRCSRLTINTCLHRLTCFALWKKVSPCLIDFLSLACELLNID